MPSELQNFDLYELGSRTAADMYEHDGASNKRITETIRRVVGNHADDVEAEGFEPMIQALIEALTTQASKDK